MYWSENVAVAHCVVNTDRQSCIKIVSIIIVVLYTKLANKLWDSPLYSTHTHMHTHAHTRTHTRTQNTTHTHRTVQPRAFLLPHTNSWHGHHCGAPPPGVRHESGAGGLFRDSPLQDIRVHWWAYQYCWAGKCPPDWPRACQGGWGYWLLVT